MSKRTEVQKPEVEQLRSFAALVLVLTGELETFHADVLNLLITTELSHFVPLEHKRIFLAFGRSSLRSHLVMGSP